MRAIEVGDQFRDMDRRTTGRVVEVIALLEGSRYLVRVESHPFNEAAVGRKYPVSDEVLRYRFLRVSR